MIALRTPSGFCGATANHARLIEFLRCCGDSLPLASGKLCLQQVRPFAFLDRRIDAHRIAAFHCKEQWIYNAPAPQCLDQPFGGAIENHVAPQQAASRNNANHTST